jgi:GT2 family glycosyltransferase
MQSVDAVIPVYNEKPNLILVTVNSLNSQTYKINRIFLVDDGSSCPTDFDYIVATSRIPVRVLRLSRNSGISAARNYGMHQSDADLLLFVNSGIELCPEWVEKTASFLAAHSEAGLASGQVSTIQNGLGAKWWQKCFIERREPWTDRTHEIPWATAHAVIIAARDLRQLGGWNEQMRRVYEDVELSQRLRATGLKIYQVRGAIGFCHDQYTIRVLAAKAIRNCGWSLDPSYPGDASLRRLEFFATLQHFVVTSFVQLIENLKRLRLVLVPIDLSIIVCGVYLIVQGNLRKLR